MTEDRPAVGAGMGMDDDRDGPGWGPFGAPTTALGAAFLLAGVLWPQAAELLLRALLAILAMGFVLVRIQRADLPAREVHDAFSPFDGEVGTGRRPSSPEPIRKLAAELDLPEEGNTSSSRAIPFAVAHLLVLEARRRLAEHHGLNPLDPSHRAAVAGLVSEATLRLVTPESGHRDGGLPTGYPPVPLSWLDRILDDLEEL